MTARFVSSLSLFDVEAPAKINPAELRIENNALSLHAQGNGEDIAFLGCELGPIWKRGNDAAFGRYAELSMVVKNDISFDLRTRTPSDTPVLNRVKAWQACRIETFDDCVAEFSGNLGWSPLGGHGGECKLCCRGHGCQNRKYRCNNYTAIFLHATVLLHGSLVELEGVDSRCPCELLSRRIDRAGEGGGEGESTRVVSKRFEEQLRLHGRQFVLTCVGPVEANRYEVHIREMPGGHLLTRAPVRGRNPDDARDRALEVMRTMLGIERLQKEIIMVAAELAPGADVELTEDAHAIYADLTGPWQLSSPLAIPRDDVTDPELEVDVLRARIRDHFLAHVTRMAD